jgi:cobalamin biosynthesis protein CobC
VVAGAIFIGVVMTVRVKENQHKTIATLKAKTAFVNGQTDIARVHGGGINAAAREFNLPRERWLDLSTGINPNGYPIDTLPAEVWQRLPEDDDGLQAIALSWFAAGTYFDTYLDTHLDIHLDDVEIDCCLPVAGSQAALQLLPFMRKACRVGVPAVGYAEHELAWRAAGHQVVRLLPEQVDAALAQLDVLVCINPNNPTGETVAAGTLIDWHRQLSARGGWLVVDEAFAPASISTQINDDERSESLAAYFFQLSAAQQNSGLILLRSLGKFFGLAGLRAGLMFADPSLCKAIKDRLGPWALSHPARYVMARALADVSWQATAAEQLRQQRQRLVQLLLEAGFTVQGHTDLFVYCPHPFAQRVATQLAQQAILVRYFDHPSALRFGLPGNEPHWQQLARALAP